MSLAADESEGEQMELRSLQAQLEITQSLVQHLSHQLSELRDQVLNMIILVSFNLNQSYVSCRY